MIPHPLEGHTRASWARLKRAVAGLRAELRYHRAHRKCRDARIALALAEYRLADAAARLAEARP